ncbi:MAG: DVUA0089 family protein [Fimbriimonadales bacterium]|nr:MAG: hypothetical protein KatS3mg018_1336 [Fimbriimonadales bacterium]
MKRATLWLSSIAIAALMASAGAQTWDETTDGGGDAGDLPASAQTTIGTGALNTITGTYDASDADLFLIKIVDPQSFSAIYNASTNFDTQIWLFDASGNGIAHNDDRSGLGLRSGLAGTDVFTTGVNAGQTIASQLVAGGLYLLGVTRYNRDARDGANAAIFANSPFSGIHSPQAGAGPLASWVNSTVGNGVYQIDLTGAEYAAVPEPASMVALGAGLAGLLGLRRRKK